VQTLFSVFDRDGSGGIDYNEFLRAVRGDMSASRKALVERAFHLIDKTGDGILAIEDIKGTYNAKNHPDVRMGKKTEDEVLGEFLSTFETHHSITKGGAGLDQRVDIDEFMEYYNNISASIDDDRYFDLMMKMHGILKEKLMRKHGVMTKHLHQVASVISKLSNTWLIMRTYLTVLHRRLRLSFLPGLLFHFVLKTFSQN